MDKPARITISPARRTRGFSLVEMMVAMGLGLLLTFAAASVYLSSKTSFRRQAQMSAVQQNVRMAFEYLAADGRMAGHLGCYTNQDVNPVDNFTAKDFTNRYAVGVGVEGYEYKNTAKDDALTLSSASPSNNNTATDWETNKTGTITLPMSTIAGTAASDGLTPGSDALVIRTVAGRGVRLTADVAAGDKAFTIENLAGGTCADGTAKLSGLCKDSHVLVASCKDATVFEVASIAGTTVGTPDKAFEFDSFQTTSAEVFPLQTIAYYVKKSSSGAGTSLYRRIFDGTVAAGVEQELVTDVENMQLRYGVDTTTPAPDGIVDSYVTAELVDKWSQVVAIRMSLLLRAPEVLPDAAATKASERLNGVEVTFPDKRYERRVFTTTVGVRNKISYF